ncbi:MAG: METTL5 family protein [Candidatus Asgardarchaeia archaeon]
MIPRKKLAMLLEEVEPLTNVKLSLEQYTISADLAATILFIAENTYKDISNKAVCDLGCGSGRLAIGAALLGAKTVYAVDVDKDAILLARKNATKLGVKNKIIFLNTDVRELSILCDTVIMNPPFGSWHKHFDMIFLDKAIEIGKVIYSLHKSNNKIRNFITKFVKSRNRKLDTILKFPFDISHTYEFHRKKRYRIFVDLYRII